MPFDEEELDPHGECRHEIQRLQALLRECCNQFRFYEKNHRAKHTADADAKAEVNKQMAEKCETALAGTNQ